MSAFELHHTQKMKQKNEYFTWWSVANELCQTVAEEGVVF